MSDEEILDGEEEIYTLVLEDDEGTEYEFEVLAELEIEDETYRVLMPLSQEEEDEDVIVVLKVVYDEEGNEFMGEIDDDEELEMVVNAWEELEENLEV